MENSFNLLSILTLLGAAQGFFLGLALINTRSGDQKAHRILGLLTFLFALDLAEEFLYQTGFFLSVPALLNVLAPIDMLYGPLIYLYVRQLTSREQQATLASQYWHFLPALAGIIVLLPFFLMPGADKLAFTEALRHGQSVQDDIGNDLLISSGFSAFMLGTVIQLGLYLFFSIRRLIRHAKTIRDEFSDIEKINLDWLRYLLMGLSAIYLILLGDQFFPDLLGMNILGDLTTVLAVVLIYAMGYLGLRQPAIFTQRYLPRTAQTIPAEEQPERKYQRSGLDSETGRVFVQELTQYMETSKPYLDGNLTLPELAQQLGISANYLSQIINEQLQVNFYDFVNSYRVAAAKSLINIPSQEKLNILNIALDSGFNSKSAFYTAFKKTTSMTPTQYRKSLY